MLETSTEARYVVTCEICNREFSGPMSAKQGVNSNLRRHMRTHTNSRPHACKLCDATFTTSTNLKRHVRIAHQSPSARPLSPQFQCPKCPKKFHWANSLSQHIARHRREEEEEEATATEVTCEDCGATLSSKTKLRRHQQLHCPFREDITLPPAAAEGLPVTKRLGRRQARRQRKEERKRRRMGEDDSSDDDDVVRSAPVAGSSPKFKRHESQSPARSSSHSLASSSSMGTAVPTREHVVVSESTDSGAGRSQVGGPQFPAGRTAALPRSSFGKRETQAVSTAARTPPTAPLPAPPMMPSVTIDRLDEGVNEYACPADGCFSVHSKLRDLKAHIRREHAAMAELLLDMLDQE